MKFKDFFSAAFLVFSAVAAAAGHAESITLDMARSDSGNLYIHATLGNDTETDLLVDTGSGYVALSKNTFKQLSALKTPQFSRHIYGAMANGKVEKVPLYVLEQLKLSENCVLKDIEVAVFPRADRDILGLNALARLQPFTMQLQPAKLISGDCASTST